MADKAYTCLTISKIKTEAKLRAASSHNARMSFSKNEKALDNADPEKDFYNLDLMPMFSGKGHIVFYEIKDKSKYEGFNFTKLWHDRMCNLPKYAKRNYSSIRNDAVLALEIVTSFSNKAKDSLNLEEWRKANIEWINKTFNVSPDNRNNIISAIYHQDERTPHIHFIVVPIDERGVLCASRWINGRELLQELHKSYDLSMQPLGLEKSVTGSKALKQDLPHIYEMIQTEAKIPEMEEGENIENYKERVTKALKAKAAQQYLEIENKKNEALREISIIQEESKKEIQEEFERVQSSKAKDLNKLDDEMKEKTDALQVINETINQNVTILNNSLLWEKASKTREFYRQNPEANEHFEIVIDLINNYDEDDIQKDAPVVMLDDSEFNKAV